MAATTARLAWRQRPQRLLRLSHDLAHDVAGALAATDEADALAGPQRQGVDVAFGVGGWGQRAIVDDLRQPRRAGHDRTFAGTGAGGRPAGGLPGLDGLVAQHTVWRVGPADIEERGVEGAGLRGRQDQLL